MACTAGMLPGRSGLVRVNKDHCRKYTYVRKTSKCPQINNQKRQVGACLKVVSAGGEGDTTELDNWRRGSSGGGGGGGGRDDDEGKDHQDTMVDTVDTPHVMDNADDEEGEGEGVRVLAQCRTAVLRGQTAGVVAVEEKEVESLGTYMTLPASEYSVLDAKRVERIDQNTFRCYVAGFKFFKVVVEPVLTLSVVVGDRGPTIRLLKTELQGSKTALEANEKFTATMTNVVQWKEGSDGMKEIHSDTTIQVTLDVPRWVVLPTSFVERSGTMASSSLIFFFFDLRKLPCAWSWFCAGSAVMQKMLESAVPRFLHQLQSDYQHWVESGGRR